MIETSMKDKVFAVQLALKRTSYAIVDIRGNILARDEFPTIEYDNVSDYVSALCEKLVDMMLANDAFGAIRSVGVSVPSSNHLTGNIENPANLPWKGIVPLGAMLRDQLGLAVALGNDAHNTALGEKMYGAAHGMKNFIVLNLGVGLGSCFFSEGHEHQGANGYAGEIGHTCIEDNGRPCPCGLKGCLEAYVAAAGIVQTAQELMAASDTPSKMRKTELL